MLTGLVEEAGRDGTAGAADQRWAADGFAIYVDDGAIELSAAASERDPWRSWWSGLMGDLFWRMALRVRLRGLGAISTSATVEAVTAEFPQGAYHYVVREISQAIRN